MTTPINLNRARKARARAERRRTADANAVKFGRTKAEREADRAAREAEARRIDGHRREDADAASGRTGDPEKDDA